MARKVLVVDDEPLVLDVVATMLEDLGYAVETSSTPQEALRRLGSEPDIDILVTDVNMPGLDGRKLGFRAKQMQPTCRFYCCPAETRMAMGSRSSGSLCSKQTYAGCCPRHRDSVRMSRSELTPKNLGAPDFARAPRPVNPDWSILSPERPLFLKPERPRKFADRERSP